MNECVFQRSGSSKTRENCYDSDDASESSSVCSEGGRFQSYGRLLTEVNTTNIVKFCQILVCQRSKDLDLLWITNPMILIFICY